MRIARIFPRKTKATPDDDLVFFGYPRKGAIPEVDEIHVSVTFTEDKTKGEHLAEIWGGCTGLPIKVGGPAYKQPAGEFIPGMYMKIGYTITSRGCPNKCWFCNVHKAQKEFIELPIKDGWIIQDDNLLACSEQHIREVFEMLKRQPHKAQLRGMEAKLLKSWHVELLRDIKLDEIFFAYDTPDDYEPLIEAGKLLNGAGFTLQKRKTFSYVLVGYQGDTFQAAEKRCIDTLKAGFMPFAMLYMDESGFQDPGWASFQRSWCRVAAIVSSNKEFFKSIDEISWEAMLL
ncbi:hypothetical protein [Dehalobacter sp. TeCB1]|uniref:hypothetical protein n=1 Tax=Dehalobacter sp. TeCB1 TaxID=1843715 RepID=UPI00083A536E|nr:hypothetical protein [Dehalobacter sp. TeCB1]OCZ54332.1 hypothetical protein A7D23_06080 [Dehalobacter sp. TeCB1]